MLIAAVDGSAENLAGPRGSDLYLDVELNGMPSGLMHFGWRDGELWASTSALRQLGFVLPPGTTDPMRLKSLPGVAVTYDAQRQRVTLMAPLALLKLATTQLSTPGTTAQPATASPGLLLNYDLYGTRAQQGAASLSAFTELRAFSSAGVISNTALTQAIRSITSGWQSTTTRLDTTWSKSYQDEMLTLRVGDTLTGSLPWTRATRIGGVQLSTNFALQPYRITAPLPAFLGSATLPSDVELYVNGLRQYSGKVPAGPFQLNTAPNITGSGNAQVVLTDALGRATTLNFSLYDTQQLLQKGLSDWSVDLGAVRNNYGLRSFDYGSDPAASGTWRYGLTDNFTFEAHAEAMPGLALTGAGGVWQLGAAGKVSGAASHSVHGSQQGSQLNLGYSWRNQRFNFGLNATGTRGDYLDVASQYGALPARGTGSAVLGYNTQNLGSMGMSYLYLRYPGQSATRFATAYWFKSIGRSTSLNLSVNQNLDDRSQRSLFFGISMALDGNVSLSGGMQRDQGRSTYTVDASRSAPSEGGVGWRAGLRQGDGQNGGQTQVDYLGRYGRVGAGVSVLDDSRYAYASASGGLVLMGGQTFATRRVDDAFAVVSTDGIAGVPVKLENRAIGITDSQGMLLVTPLRAYQNNQLAIDSMQLPSDVRIDRVKALATPTDRAGTLVRFGITPVRAALIILVDEAGKPLSVGSLARLQGAAAKEPTLVGFDGEAYLDALNLQNVLDVETTAGVCSVSFDYPKSGSGIPQIGPLPCLKEVAP
ncbi:MAG: fimbria/pilus outer membrane usher protein [Polaromonas sp.]